MVNNQLEKEAAAKLNRAIDQGADIAGSVTGATTGFLMGGPVGAAFGAAAGSFLGHQIRRIGLEVIQRQLSPREEVRVGAVVAVAADAIRSRLETGESPRSDGFFDHSNGSRSSADEIAEGIILKCQREVEERKIYYMGNLMAGIAFDESISLGMANQIIKSAEELTYKQLCLLRLSVLRSHFGLRATDYRGVGEFKKELYDLLYECLGLYRRAFVNFGGEVAFGPTDVKPGAMQIQALGTDIYNLMKLALIPAREIQPIATILR